jgi:hypothetical protein
MIWVAVLLLWLVATVLTGHRNRFAIGVLTTGMLAVVILHAINPDALIAQTNLDRARAGRRAFDSVYASRLSDDAAPVIFANAGAFTDLTAFVKFSQRRRPRGWRSLNYSRERARDLAAAAVSR